MIRLDAATVLLQWATGGLIFGWVTTRRREVSLGYGWLVRSTYLVMLAASVAVGSAVDDVVVGREGASIAAGVATVTALAASVLRRRAGVAGDRARRERASARVEAMTGIERRHDEAEPVGAEFPPVLDLLAPALGLVGLVAAGIDAGDPALLAVLRTLIGAAFLGSISDAMLLGHWYLVQPGLPRAPLLELVRWVGLIWPAEVAVLIWPTGMFSVFSGSIDDGYGGMLGWFWAACAIGTIALVGVTRAALRERQYAAVMAATGLLYLAILTAFGTDLVARATLAG